MQGNSMAAKFEAISESEEDYFGWYKASVDDTYLDITKLEFPLRLEMEKEHYGRESFRMIKGVISGEIGRGVTLLDTLRLPQVTYTPHYFDIIWQEPKITTAANKFLEMNPGIEEKVLELNGRISSILHDKNVMNESYIDIARDIEYPKWEAIKIRVEISGKSYSDILDIWGQVSKEIYKDLDKDIAKRIYIVMDEVENK